MTPQYEINVDIKTLSGEVHNDIIEHMMKLLMAVRDTYEEKAGCDKILITSLG